jgi:hypothetical protein
MNSKFRLLLMSGASFILVTSPSLSGVILNINDLEIPVLSTSADAGDEGLASSIGTYAAQAYWPPPGISGNVTATGYGSILEFIQQLDVGAIIKSNSNPFPAGQANGNASLQIQFAIVYNYVNSPTYTYPVTIYLSGLYTPNYTTSTSSVVTSLSVTDPDNNVLYSLTTDASGIYRATLTATSNVIYTLNMSVEASSYDNVGLDVKGMIDPFFAIDPSQANDFHLIFSPGVGNGVSSVPELSTWAMLLLGFAGLGFAGYRSRRPLSRA